MDSHISVATDKDLPQIAQLVNSAYRGDEAKKGWTHEADLIAGTLRTDEDSLLEEMSRPGAVILKYNNGDSIVGCVYLHKQNQKLYLGMLSVSPQMQAGGIGKQLLTAAENYASKNNCYVIEMTVITIRKELIAWYQRHGYEITDEKRPFHDEEKFGVPRQPIEFVVMKKHL